MHRALFLSIHGDPLASLGGIQSGGQNVYVRELAIALGEAGWEVDVFTHWSDIEKPPMESLGRRGRVIRLAAGRPGFVPKDDLFHILPAFMAELHRWVHAHGADYQLIHSNYWHSGWVGNHLQRAWLIPQVHVSHSLGLVRAAAGNGPFPATRVREERRILQGSSAVVATSPQEKEITRQEYGVPPQRVRVIPCGVDPDRFAPRERAGDRHKLGLLQEKLVLFVGRLEPHKGLDVLLQALALVKASRMANSSERVVLWVAGGEANGASARGDHAYRQHLQRLIQGLQLAEDVRFLGPVNHEELPVYYGAADVCAIPSFYESFGLVAIEAMACGCPVVASRVGGLRYTVEDGRVGFTVPPNSPADLAHALQRILIDTQLRHRLSQEAAAKVAHHFTWPQIARRMAALYEEVILWKTPPKPLPTTLSWPPTWTARW